MTTLDFASLQQVLPDSSMSWAGFGAPLNLNLTAVTQNNELTPESLLLEAFGRLLDALVELQSTINQERSIASPPQSPINVIEKSISSHNGNPVFQWAVQIEVAASSSLNDPINPASD